MQSNTIISYRIRGTLGSMTQLSRNSGILAAYGLGAWLHYDQTPYVFISIPIIYMINFVLLPNTPQYFVKKGKFTVSRKLEITPEINRIEWYTPYISTKFIQIGCREITEILQRQQRWHGGWSDCIIPRIRTFAIDS